jgi:Fe-S cluster assembly iron-binding protein IscA
VVEKNGLNVYLDCTASDKLKDMQMDYVEDAHGSGFVLKGGSSAGSDCGSCGH